MGNIPVYTAQNSALTAIPQPTASPDDMGAGIGRALQGLGQQVTGLAGDLRDHQQRKAGIEGQLALAQARLDMTNNLVQLENSDAAGNPDFAASYVKQFDDYEAKALDALPNNQKVRDAFKVGMAGLRASLGSRATLTEATMAAAKMAGDAKNTLAIGINTVAVDPTQYDEVIANGQKLISELNLPPNDREATNREFVDAVTAARFNALFAAAKTPDAIAGVIADLKGGDWQKVMGAKQFEETLRLAERAQNSIETVMSEQARIAVASIEDRIKGGVVLDQMEIAEVGAQVKLANDPTLTNKWVRLRVQYDTNQKVKGLSTPELRGYTKETLGKGMSSGLYRDAIANIETEWGGKAKGSGYGTVGPVTNGDRPYGRYQVMGNNIPVWTRQALGRSMTPAQFLAEPRAQDAVFDFKFGQFIKRYGSAAEAASVWFTGQPISRGANRRDVVGTSGSEYVARFNDYVAGGGGGTGEFEFVRGTAAQGVIDAREKLIKDHDMMTAGEQAGLYTLNQLTGPTDFVERGRQSGLAASFLETENEPFTPSEVESFKQVMDEGTIEDKIALLDNINAMGSVSEKAFEQIGDKTPLLGYIGGLSVEAPGVAREILRGQQRLQDNPDLKDALATGDNGGTIRQFASVTQGAFDMLPEVAHAARLGADALYVQRMGAAAAGEFDPDVYAQAVKDVLGGQGENGGVAVINDKAVVLPPGVDGDDFETMLSKLTTSDLIEFSVGGGAPQYDNGAPASPQEIAAEGQFNAIAVGSYTITMADGKPLAGTGPNGFYVFQVEAQDVTEVVERPEPETVEEIESGAAEELSGVAKDAGVTGIDANDEAFNKIMEDPNVSPEAKVIARKLYMEFKRGERKSWISGVPLAP